MTGQTVYGVPDSGSTVVRLLPAKRSSRTQRCTAAHSAVVGLEQGWS